MKQIRVLTPINLGRHYYAAKDIALVSDDLADWAVAKGFAVLYAPETADSSTDQAPVTKIDKAPKDKMVRQVPKRK